MTNLNFGLHFPPIFLQDPSPPGAMLSINVHAHTHTQIVVWYKMVELTNHN